MGRLRGLTFGVGVNDSDYAVRDNRGGRLTMCHFFQTWLGMMKRCYSEKYQLTRPTYIGCSVHEGWHRFTDFKSWMEKQDWEGNQLDKDLIVSGNKIYSSETCAFVDLVTNNFITDRSSDRGLWPIGVDFNNGKFRAQCCNPFKKKNEHLGYFSCPEKAHEAWRKRKHELACQLADMQTDGRAANALRTRYL